VPGILPTGGAEMKALSRKVREVALAQKQKERDFVLARRAIERIRMAI